MSLAEKLVSHTDADLKKHLFQIKIIPNGNKVNGETDDKDEVIEKGEVESTKEKEKDGDKEKKEDQEVLFIQDLAFTVKISSPGTDSFDIQASRKINKYYVLKTFKDMCIRYLN